MYIKYASNIDTLYKKHKSTWWKIKEIREKMSINKKKLEKLEEKTKNLWKSKQINLKYVYIIWFLEEYIV